MQYVQRYRLIVIAKHAECCLIIALASDARRSLVETILSAWVSAAGLPGVKVGCMAALTLTSGESRYRSRS